MRRAMFAAVTLFISAAASAQSGTLPPAIYTDPPKDAAHPARMEVLHIPTGGVAINGVAYLAAGAGPHPTVVICHGLPGIEKNLDLAQAARRGGEPLEAIVRGVRGYAAYCERRGLVGTEKVKMAATFFGSERSWREPWSQPQTGAATGPPRGTKEWVTCPTCDADYPRLIGEPDPHACPAQRAAQ